MSVGQINQKRGAMPAPHQGSCAEYPRAEKVMALAFEASPFAYLGQSVQPAYSEVRRPKPAWIKASSNRPTSPTKPRTHMRVTRIRARRTAMTRCAFANIENESDGLGG